MSEDLDPRWTLVKEGYSPSRVIPELVDDERTAWTKGMIAYYEASGQNLSLLDAGEMLTAFLFLKKLCERRNKRMLEILPEMIDIHCMSGVNL